MLTRIKNGYLAGLGEVSMPWSSYKERLAALLIKQGYAAEKKVKAEGSRKNLILTLKYDQEQPAITEVKRVSRPSLRIYVSKNNIPSVLGGLGVAILSTPAGLLTDKEARKKGLGGEVIAEIW